MFAAGLLLRIVRKKTILAVFFSIRLPADKYRLTLTTKAVREGSSYGGESTACFFSIGNNEQMEKCQKCLLLTFFARLEEICFTMGWKKRVLADIIFS